MVLINLHTYNENYRIHLIAFLSLCVQASARPSYVCRVIHQILSTLSVHVCAHVSSRPYRTEHLLRGINSINKIFLSEAMRGVSLISYILMGRQVLYARASYMLLPLASSSKISLAAPSGIPTEVLLRMLRHRKLNK